MIILDLLNTLWPVASVGIGFMLAFSIFKMVARAVGEVGGGWRVEAEADYAHGITAALQSDLDALRNRPAPSGPGPLPLDMSMLYEDVEPEPSPAEVCRYCGRPTAGPHCGAPYA